MEIINGISIAKEIREKVKEINEQNSLKPKLAIVVVGDDKESLVYVGLKEKAVEFTGGETHYVLLPATSSKEDIIKEIKVLNQDTTVDGILVQLPLPGELADDTEEILSAIDPYKDVDGFTPANRGLLLGDKPGFISCAALAAMEVIERYETSLAGKKVTLVGDSFDLIFPLTVLLTKSGCIVTLVPEYDARSLNKSDIFVFEKGQAGIVKADNVNSGAIVIDAGFHWETYDKICGNVDRESLEDVDGYLLPVPGGIGPILISKLMENLSKAAGRNANRNE